MNWIFPLCAASIVALLAPAASAAPAATPSAPPAEYIDRGACPFECCTYRKWTTLREVTLVDKPRSSTVVTRVRAGAAVKGLTGQVISNPRRWVAVRNLEAMYPGDNASYPGIRKGDAYYVLHYSGEGFWAVWHKGHVVIASLEKQDGAPADGGDPSVWWVQIRTADGKTGWVISTDNFGNQDACG